MRSIKERSLLLIILTASLLSSCHSFHQPIDQNSQSAKLTKTFVAELTSDTNVKAKTYTLNELNSPVGYWLVVDEDAQKPYGVIKFHKLPHKDKEQVSGQVFAILNIPDDAWKYRDCTGCIAPFTNKSVIGMNFLYDYTATGTQWNSPWTNGKLFNFYFKNTTYRSKLWLTNNGLEMNVRGYYLGLFYTVTLYRISYEQALSYRKTMYTQMNTALSKQSKALKKNKK